MRSQHEQRSHPWSKVTTTEQEDAFFRKSLETPKSSKKKKLKIDVVQTALPKNKFKRQHKNP
jgi:hypothetical protein